MELKRRRVFYFITKMAFPTHELDCRKFSRVISATYVGTEALRARVSVFRLRGTARTFISSDSLLFQSRNFSGKRSVTVSVTEEILPANADF